MEAFDTEERSRARNFVKHLTAQQVDELQDFLNGLEVHEGLMLENKYHQLCGRLLEPVIARYWLRTGVIAK